MNNVQMHLQPLKARIQGWPYTQEWVRGGLKLRSGSGVGSDSEVGQGWAQTQKWVRGGLRLTSESGVGSYSELVCFKSILKHCIVLCEFLHTQSDSHTTPYKLHMCICYLTCDVYCNCCLISCVTQAGHMSICLPPTIDCRQQDYPCIAYVYMHTCSRPSPIPVAITSEHCSRTHSAFLTQYIST